MELFGNAALVIAAAALLVFVMHRLRQSAIVAHLLLGMVVGPHALDLVPSSAAVGEMAEIGVVLLLFFIGLEFHVVALKRMASLALIGTLLQMALTTAAIAALSRLLGFTTVQGLAVGFCIALSSTAIVMKAFEDQREADTPWAQSSLAILLGQDLFAMAAIAASALLPATAGANAATAEGEHGRNLWFLLGLPLLVVAARFLLPRLFRKAALSQNPELFALSSLAACFLVAAAARELGASLVLGAFLGGMVFADTPFAHQIRADLATVKNLALGLFFLSVGMLVDLGFVAHHPLLLAGALLAVVAVKLVVTTLVLRVFRIPWSVAAASGLALAQVSEFVFVLAAGAGASLLGDAARQLLPPLAVVTMLPTPLLVGVAGRFGRGVASLLGHPAGEPLAGTAAGSKSVFAAKAAPVVPAPPPLSKTRVVVVGYGPVGRTLCRILLRMGVRVGVIDLQPATVEKLKRLGRDAVFGDATRREVLLAAGLREARCLVLTLPDQSTRAAILATARAVAPRVLVLTRARYLDEQPALERLGADHISYEEAEVAMELARLMLGSLGVAPATMEEEVRAIRSEIAVRTGFTTIMPRVPPEPPAAPA